MAGNKKHYWKKNEIKFLGELVDKHCSGVFKHWNIVETKFNEKYSYGLSSDELKNAYKLYFKEVNV